MTGPGGHKQQHVRIFAAAALLLVVAAGGVAWFGRAPSTADHRANPSTVTLAAEALAGDTPGQAAIFGSLPTRVVAPSAGIDAQVSEVGVIVDGGKPVWETAWRSVGHHMDSARPGQPGNMVLTGHVSVVDSRNLAAFKTLDRLRSGDVVEVYAGDEVYLYRITSVVVVPPDEVRVLRSDHLARMTLITCTRDLKQRLVVVGVLV